MECVFLNLGSGSCRDKWTSVAVNVSFDPSQDADQRRKSASQGPSSTLVFPLVFVGQQVKAKFYIPAACNQKKATMRTPFAPFFTYTLHNSIYVPFTSLCNTLTLPETRGPNFMLPPHVVAALLRVRDAENNTQQWSHWCTYLDGVHIAQRLPPPSASDRVREYPTSEAAEPREPRVSALLNEIQAQLNQPNCQVDSVVISGEGEPTLRLDDVLSFSRQLKETSTSTLPVVRLTTNGLVPDKDAVEQLVAHGITHVSVALMTADRDQYDELMKPMLSDGHEQVCRFIESATENSLEVEVTAVDRGEVDKTKVEALAQSLNVSKVIRWRPYFG
eukprot:scaffold1442_cov128-Cylindrotheca_fusiformis.AAC.6